MVALVKGKFDMTLKEQLRKFGEQHIDMDDALAVVRINHLNNFCGLVSEMVEKLNKPLGQVIVVIKENQEQVKQNYPFITDAIDEIIKKFEPLNNFEKMGMLPQPDNALGYKEGTINNYFSNLEDRERFWNYVKENPSYYCEMGGSLIVFLACLIDFLNKANKS